MDFQTIYYEIADAVSSVLDAIEKHEWSQTEVLEVYNELRHALLESEVFINSFDITPMDIYKVEFQQIFGRLLFVNLRAI